MEFFRSFSYSSSEKQFLPYYKYSECLKAKNKKKVDRTVLEKMLGFFCSINLKIIYLFCNTETIFLEIN